MKILPVILLSVCNAVNVFAAVVVSVSYSIFLFALTDVCSAVSVGVGWSRSLYKTNKHMQPLHPVLSSPLLSCPPDCSTNHHQVNHHPDESYSARY